MMVNCAGVGMKDWKPKYKIPPGPFAYCLLNRKATRDWN